MRAPRFLLERLAGLVLGLYLLGIGLHALVAGRWLYRDYLGLGMPAPLAVVAGLAALAFAAFYGRRRRGRR
jgi:membrane protein implicated in regulation of membrane protease activity